MRKAFRFSHIARLQLTHRHWIPAFRRRIWGQTENEIILGRANRMKLPFNTHRVWWRRVSAATSSSHPGGRGQLRHAVDIDLHARNLLRPDCLLVDVHVASLVTLQHESQWAQGNVRNFI